MKKYFRTSVLKMIILFVLVENLSAAEQKENELINKFDSLLTNKFKCNEPGAAVLIAKDGKIIYKQAFGMANLELDIPMQSDNIFKIGSITKQFTAIAILRLMENGKLNLQDDITKFIPDYPTHGYNITIEHLLTHTSGIQDYSSMKDYFDKMVLDWKPAEMIEYFKNEPMKFEPGTQWEYNNSGYFLLGFIIEKITGITYGEYIYENFFKPLNMKSTYYGNDRLIVKKRTSGYSKTDNDYENARPLSMTQPYAAGSILSTPEDLFMWHQAIHSYKLVKKETLDKAFAGYRLSNGKITDYGFGWYLGWVHGRRAIFHGGGINGFKSVALYLPEENVYVVVLSNCECHDSKEIAFDLTALTFGESTNLTSELKLSKEILNRYVGEYRMSPDFSFNVTIDQDKLFVQATGQEKFEVNALSENKFFLKVNDAQIEFIENESGDVIKAIIYQNGRKAEAEKTEFPE